MLVMVYRYRPPAVSLVDQFVDRGVIEAVSLLVQTPDGASMDELQRNITFARTDDIEQVLDGFMDSGLIYRSYVRGVVRYRWSR